MQRVETVLSDITTALGLARALAEVVARYGAGEGDLPLRSGSECAVGIMVLRDVSTGEIEIDVSPDPEMPETDLEPALYSLPAPV